MAKNGALSAKQQNGIRALLTERTIGDAAKLAGVSRRTFDRWRADPAFQEALAAAELEALTTLCRSMAGTASDAQAALLEIMSDPNAPAMARVRAASAYLTHLPALRAGLSLEQRLAALEGLLSG